MPWRGQEQRKGKAKEKERKRTGRKQERNKKERKRKRIRAGRAGLSWKNDWVEALQEQLIKKSGCLVAKSSEFPTNPAHTCLSSYYVPFGSFGKKHFSQERVG